MELMLNTTTGYDNPYEKKPKQNKPKTHYSGSGSGFAFEFTENDTVKAQVIARKRVVKPAPEGTSVEKPVEKPVEFKLVQPDPVTPKKKTSSKKKPESTFNLEELLKKDDVPNYEIPTALPTVDFPDDSKSSKKNKNKQNKPLNNFPKELPTVDFAEPVKVFVKPLDRKKQKVKFSKVTNPFPNDPRKNPVNAKSVKEEKTPLKEATANTRTEKDGNKSVFSVDSVDSLKIHAHSIKNMKEVLNFNKLTHVQQKSVPAALEGRDLLIRSPTGSGKTLSYALPIVEKLHNIRPKLARSDGIHALVIVPTRELAVQTYELFVKLTKPFQWIVPGYLSGGEKRKAEKSRLRNGITILISTPGRICDHLLHTESMKFDKIQVFALDEADRLLELGYENDVKKVVDTIAEQNKDDKPIQKILLSATLTSSVKKLAGLTLSDPVYVDNDSTETMTNSMMDMESDDNLVIPAGIEQKYFMIPPKLRFVVLCSLVTQQMALGARKILIFFPTQHVVDFNYDVMVEFLTQRFTKKERTAKSYLENEDDDDMGDEEDDDEDDSDIWLPNVTFFKLFGSMTQVERISVFKEFKKVKSGILLCTDVAARGLDVPELDLVIQYSAPQELNNYVHRIGRTARAGNTGSAILFITSNEDKFIDLLRQKNIEIAEDDYHKCLKDIRLPNSKIRFFEEKIVALQRKLEDLLAEDDEIRHKASKAFTSWICYYKTFSKELRHIFNLREIHMGHLANNLGLRDAPTSIVKQYANASEGKREKNKNFDFQHRVHVPRGDQNSINKLKRKYGDFTKTNFGKTSNISEFDSGLPDLKKKRK